MARKFHVDRALALYQQHELMRIREGLTVFDPASSPLKEELKTGKFTILPGKDANGATLALFNAHRHEPQGAAHRTTLQVRERELHWEVITVISRLNYSWKLQYFRSTGPHLTSAELLDHNSRSGFQ